MAKLIMQASQMPIMNYDLSILIATCSVDYQHQRMNKHFYYVHTVFADILYA